MSEKSEEEYSNFKRLLQRLSKNKAIKIGGIIIILVTILPVFASVLAPYNPAHPHVENLLEGPSGSHLLGTDELGRDILSRVIFGSRITVKAAIFPVLMALVIGIPAGLLAGYKGGLIDTLFMRLMDALLSFPPLILALSITAVLGSNLTNAFIAIGIVLTPGFARLIRGEVLKIREKEYVEAAKALGVKDLKIVFKHILPNAVAPIIVHTTLSASMAILTEAGLSFLGLGSQPPIVSWGAMLRTAVGYLDYNPWMAIGPGIALFITIMGLNYLGDGLREIFDTKLEISE